jgi:hypothetical protein
MELTRETIDPLIARYFAADAITEGFLQKQAYIRYTGRFLTPETAQVHNEMMDLLEPDGMVVLFREEDSQEVITVLKLVPQTGEDNRTKVSLFLMVLTLFSMLVTGSLNALPPTTPANMIWQETFAHLLNGLPFAVSFFAILASHEFGHYLMGRYHKTPVTLPFFIPLPPPFSSLGTLGAFIQMKREPRNRNHLLDIGLAGPFAGLIVTIPILIFGLLISKVETLPTSMAAGSALQMEGNSILYLFLKFVTQGQLLPAPATYGNVQPILYWIKYFFTSRPFPLGGSDVMLSPVAWAGWAGLLVTMLNLIPVGQLDGGHAFNVLFGEKGRRIVFPVIVGILGILGIFWNGWWLWAVLILFFGRMTAQPLDMITPVDGKRKLLAALALIIFLLIFMPVPLVLVGI